MILNLLFIYFIRFSLLTSELLALTRVNLFINWFTPMIIQNNYLISKMFQLNDEQLQSFKKAFDLFDKDGNGKINKEQITTVFKELNIRLTQNDIDRIIHQFDENGDQCIEFEEFITVLSNNIDQGDSEAWLFQVFEIIDQDSDGLISKDELIKIIKLYNLEIEEKDINLIMEACDQYGQNGINYEQFSNFLKFK